MGYTRSAGGAMPANASASSATMSSGSPRIGSPNATSTPTHALWDDAHQSFALRRWVSENKFGPHRVVCRTPLTNIRITTFFAGEHEVRVLDPSRVELLAAIGCEVTAEG